MKFSMIKRMVVCCALVGSVLYSSPVFAKIVPDIPVDPNSLPIQSAGSEELSVSLNDPNTAILVYKAGDDTIVSAMNNIGAMNVRYRSSSTPVTAEDWEWCDIVVIGANSGTDSLTGIDTDDIEEQIVSRVVLSGHDADLHASDSYSGDVQWAAQTFLIQAINFVMAGSGKGLIGFGDSSAGFDWTPASWGVESTANFNEEEITAITDDGLATGIYDGLSEEDMSDWSVSFHVRFDDYGLGFKVYEKGYFSQEEGDVTIGCLQNPLGMIFEKDDGLDEISDCNVPNDEVTYAVSFNNVTDITFYDAYIVDNLPEEVDYPAGEDTFVFDGNSIYVIEGDPNYNQEDHYYVWQVGTIAPNDANCVSFTVTVNEKAEPGMLIHNVAELWGTVYDPNGQNPVERLIAITSEDTRVCCWGDDPNIIYVDQNAAGNNTGVDWADAYTDLDDALYRAENSQCEGPYTIYVAQGTYAPQDTENGFVLPEGCSVYGGYKGGPVTPDDCNPKKYKTILTGLVDDDEFPDIDTVVTMGDETLLDGVTVEYAGFSGQCIYGNGVDFTIQDCIVSESYEYGIYAKNGDAIVKRCTINSNDKDGIRHEGEGFTLTVENSWLLRNGEYGINCRYSTPTAKNSIISESAFIDHSRAGIRLYRPTCQPLLQNLTISNNKAEGIYFEDDHDIYDDPNNLDWPDIQNCIIFYNNDNGPQFSEDLNTNLDNVARYCCIQDCNEINGNWNHEPEFAYTIDPNGAPDPNNYHLASGSFCIDKGDPNFNEVSFDYDGETRIMGTPVAIVDIGADEVDPTCDDVSNELDWNADGLINLNDYAVFSAAWLSYDPNHPYCDPNNPNYVSDPNAPGYISETDKERYDDRCDLVADLCVDLADLRVFWNNWLWTACWKANEIIEMLAMSGEGVSMAIESSALGNTFASSSSEMTVAETETEVSAQTLMQIIVFLDEVIAESSDNLADIEEMRAILMDELRATIAE